MRRLNVASGVNWFGVVVGILLVFELTLCSGLNGSEIESGNVTGTSRGSRQLWSLVKNVIKTGLEQSGSGNGGGSNVGGLGGGGGGLGNLASGVLSAIAGGINSNGVGGGSSGQFNNYYQQQQQEQAYLHQNPNPGQFSNPNDYMHYLLMNSQSNQHSSLPHYLQQQKKEQESTADLIEKYKQEMLASGTTNVENAAGTGSQLLNKLALGTIFDDLDKVSNFLSFARVEGMVEKINKFDKLKCIPRLLCQMVSKRKEDEKKEETKAKERNDISTTTKRPTNRKVSDDNEDENNDKKSRTDDDDDNDEPVNSKKSRKDEEGKKVADEESNEKTESEEDDEDNDDDDDEDDESEEAKEYVVIKKGAEESDKQSAEEKDGGKKKGRRNGRFLKLNGSDTALEQFVRFLDLMQLKDWSLYPYLNGAYQGHQVTRAEECAYRFSSCPFSDEQLVYYFNNYNGGFFQSI